MKYRTLGKSGLMVSTVTMGTFTFGGVGMFAAAGNQEVGEAARLIDFCIERGVNLFDTANMYSVGRSEMILGEALGDKKNDVLISSKARMRIGDGVNDEGASRFHLIRECERSLKKLGREWIDIYYLHEWDGLTPLEETLAALDTLVQHGKVRYIGCSNYCGWQLMKALGVSDRHGLSRFVTQQIHYSVEHRDAEYELLPASVDQGLGILVWSPLAGGLLTGTHSRLDPSPAGSRQAAGWNEPPIRDYDRLWNIVDLLKDIAAQHEVSAAQVALAWTLQRPAVTSVVVGGLSEAHFGDNIAAAELDLTSDDISRLDTLSAPVLLYPHWHQANFASARFSEADRALHGPRT